MLVAAIVVPGFSEPRNRGSSMAKKTRQTFQKRQKEMARQQKQKDKMVRRLEVKGPKSDDSDPDIANIRPGPQPLPAEWLHLVKPEDSEEPPQEK